MRTPSPVLILATAAACALLACGSVTSSALLSDGAAGGQSDGAIGGAQTGGAAGSAGELGGQGGSNQGGAGGVAGTAGELGGQGGSNQGGRGGAGTGGAACVDLVDANAQGFALNGGCNNEPPATATACHARCTLNGSPFVGCVDNTPFASYCFASCAACP